ncbi:hypothetical protein SAMN05444164_4715 [Bradyrhizobium erythrophlei]|uniref:Uncharacterized protein n=1 Tax=Bradyrhizobium erythrophlei TaxID=1437360 RepID=A0A1H5AK44_9BRAD|nr:hypothetical protein SAMN05444164_4715 [Bradyrhizobium erythrophlei]
MLPVSLLSLPMRPISWTRDDTRSILKLTPFFLGHGALGVLIGLATGAGWLYVAAFGVVGLAEGPIYYLAGRYYDKRHPN